MHTGLILQVSCSHYACTMAWVWEYEYYSTVWPTKKKKKSISDLGCVNTLHVGQVAQHNFVVIPSGCFTCMNEFSFTTHEMLKKKHWIISQLAQNLTGRFQQHSNLLCLACSLSTSRQSFPYNFLRRKIFTVLLKKQCCNECIVSWYRQLIFNSIQNTDLPERNIHSSNLEYLSQTVK